MTKHLRFLFVMLLAMIWSAGWAQTTVDFSNGLPTGWSQNDFVIKQTYTEKSCIQLKDNGKVTSPAFEDAYSSMKISMTRSRKGKNFTVSYQIGNAAEVVIKTFTASEVVKSSWKDYTLNIPAAAQVANCKFIFSTDVISYYISSIEFTPAGPTKTATNVSFGEYSGMKFTFSKGVYTEGEFTTPIAKEKNNIAGTVVYSSNNEDAISVDASTGKLTFNDFGEATITATFTPNNTEFYKSSNDSYEVVNDNPDVRKVTFIDTVDKGKNQSTGKSETITKDGVTIYASNAAFGYDTKYRFYKGTINISVTTGTITRIDFAGGEDLTNLKGDGFTATAKDATWTGNARSVVLTNDIGSAKARTITVYVALPSEIILNENSESNTIEAKTGVNVTLNRSMVANEWNTICLPFDVTGDKIKTVFGEGVKVAQLDNTNSTGTTLKFVDMTDYGMLAAEPYLIKPVEASPADGYKFEGVEIKETAVNPAHVKTAGGLYFNGIYNMVDITTDVASDYYAAFLGAGNKIYKTNGSGNKTKGFRAYFAIPKGAAASALRVVIDGTATSIKNIDSEVVESNAPVYNLQGQRVNGNNLTPGIYVKAGKKFVVK
ncbi:hypothetical protein [Prevotella sp.]|uniref:hypothetical protein n=1 Tax=Prevotella sp. TaxID=59823 RepID=UPI0027E2302B|nr:hypothetical protein [Prevotella sp.]